MGEICPECGANAHPYHRVSNWRAWLARTLLRLPKNLYFCGNWRGGCTTLLFGGRLEGHKTHGICPDCSKKERDAIDSAAVLLAKDGPVQ